MNQKGFFHYNEHNLKDIIRRYEDELKHIVEEVHKRWKENLSAAKDVPDSIDMSVSLGKTLSKSAIQVSN